MNRLITYILSAFVFISFHSCVNSNVVFSAEEEILEGSWNYENPLLFTLPVTDTTSYYDLSVHVKHNSDFSFQNLYVSIRSEFPDGEKIEDIVSLELADKKGKWIGSCDSNECNAPFLLKQNIRFEQIGDHRFKINQNSRQEKLEGIQSLSLLLLSSSMQK